MALRLSQQQWTWWKTLFLVHKPHYNTTIIIKLNKMYKIRNANGFYFNLSCFQTKGWHRTFFLQRNRKCTINMLEDIRLQLFCVLYNTHFQWWASTEIIKCYAIFTLKVRLEGRMRSNEGLGTPGEGGWPIWLPFPPPENVQRILDHRSRPPRPKKWISVTQTSRLLYI